MLISFSVENFRSYRERQTLSMLAENHNDELLGNTMELNIPALSGRRALRAVGIYGANASGKSNFIKAFDRLATMVLRSAGESADKELPVNPFELDDDWSARPTRLSATFIVERVLYVYEVALTRSRVYAEELTAFPKTHPQRLFRREVNKAGESRWRFSRANFKRDRGLESRTRPNSLYLSVGSQFNHPILSKIAQFFYSRADIREPRYAGPELALTMQRCMDDPKFKKWAVPLLTAADTGITDIRAGKTGFLNDIADDLKTSLPKALLKRLAHEAQLELQVAHQGTGKRTLWWSVEKESDGTRQFLSLLRSCFNLLHNNNVVLVDELDDSLHSLLSRRLLRLVGNDLNGDGHGQLIFTTHDTTLLDPTLLRRDQIFFTEKGEDGASKIYSLVEYSPRPSEAIQKGYLSGRYGAIPYLGGFKLEAPGQETAGIKKAAAPSKNRGQPA